MMKTQGYTSLIELLAVMAIIAILSFLIIPNIEQGERRQLLRRAALQLSQDLRDMEERAISSRQLPGGNTCPSGDTIPPSYGVEFFRDELGETSYRLFADCDGDGSHDDGESTLLDRNNASPVIRDFPLGIELDQKQHTDEDGSAYTPADPSHLAVTFLPPDPTVEIRRVPAPDMVYEQAWFRLRIAGANCTSRPGDCRTVWVSQTGRIFIE